MSPPAFGVEGLYLDLHLSLPCFVGVEAGLRLLRRELFIVCSLGRIGGFSFGSLGSFRLGGSAGFLLGGDRRDFLVARQRRDLVDRGVVEVALGKLLADFELDQLEQLGIVDLVDLVQVDDHGRNADLLGEQDVLLGLRHRAVGGRHDQDRAVHLGGAGDHVLHIIGVARAIDVRIVARCRSHTRRERSRW